MKVFFDHQVFSWQKVGGISRYFVELIKHMSDSIDSVLPPMWSENAFVRDLGRQCPDLKSVDWTSFRIRRKAYEWLNRRTSVLKLDAGHYSLFHPTYYDPYFLDHLKTPFVITVHDFTHERFPQFFKDASQVIANKKKVIPRADRIIAISENTKKDIMEFYNIEPERIEVIYHGATSLSNSVDKIPGLPQQYILFVGDRNKYKNFDNLLEAYAILSKSNHDLYLICTGKPFNADELRTISSFGLENKVKAIYVTNAQLFYLYTNAQCFVFPSLYEGFGLPILEAWNANCPVVLSDRSCFPEIAREGAAYFDPYNPEEMARVIGEVIYNGSLRRSLMTSARHLLPQFTWHQSAFRTVSLYRKVIENESNNKNHIW